MSVVVVAGTRPEVVKLYPVLKRLDELSVECYFVWSGQHYDYEMSRIFFEELGVRSPDVDLDVRSGSHAEQTGRIMLGVERVLRERRPVVTVAQGDTNSVLAAALASVKVRVPFAHVEAGLRSWSMVMPEEVNRRVADAVASLHFAPTRLAALNLIFEGVSPRGIHVTGNTVVDVIYEQGSRVDALAERLLGDLGLEKAGYVLATLHRAENVD
ncbi:MAG: UDP-N-acetylglucosamine 2-epimerase, partial [Thermofilaceae archaeon]